jgi:hypothetical protein
VNPERLSEVFSAGLVLALLGTALWYGVRPTGAPAAFVGPSAEELDSLSRYLQPVPPAPDVEEYDMFIPAMEAAPGAAGPPPEPAGPAPRRLTAILVVGSDPIAIIDDLQVRTGTVLPGGTQVVAIDRSGVVLREPNGSQRTLRLSATDQLGP